MPEKQTRESIEAEMTASEVERAVAKLQEAMRDMEEFERRLQHEEREWGITPIPSKPLVERMAAVGMSKEVIDYVSDMLGAVTKIGLGRIDEVPHRIWRDLTETADAEISALDQLQDLLDARRR
jgi:hypothetical protein